MELNAHLNSTKVRYCLASLFIHQVMVSCFPATRDIVMLSFFEFGILQAFRTRVWEIDFT